MDLGRVPGQALALEQIFCKWFRCEIVHQGGLPVDVRFMDGIDPGDLSVRAGGAPEYMLVVSPDWFYQLIAWAQT